jgi:hypothetical protein
VAYIVGHPPEADRFLEIQLKQGQSHYDREVLALALLHPGTIRRLYCRWCEVHWTITADNNYGNQSHQREYRTQPGDWVTPLKGHADYAQARTMVLDSARAAGIAV